ncbi:MAG: response regulator [Spirochaetes bacterium]|nr:response regulator [Spirochaetota bacterium]
MRILVVDDERKLALSLKECFEPEGVDADLAFDGREARAKLEEEIYDLSWWRACILSETDKLEPRDFDFLDEKYASGHRRNARNKENTAAEMGIARRKLLNKIKEHRSGKGEIWARI